MRVPTIPTSVIAGAIKAFPVGVGLPIMAIAASVGPDELASNLSKWYRLIGLGDPPTWLSDANFDRKALIVLFALATVYAFFAYIYPLLRKLIQWLFPARKRLITYSVPGSAVTICLIATFFAWKLWPGSQINMPPMPLAAASPTVSASPSIRKEKLASHFNKLILVCTYSLMPTSRNTKSLDLKTITKEVKTLLGAQDLGVSDTLSAEVYKAQIVPTASGPGTIAMLLNSMAFEEHRLNNKEVLITEQIVYNGLVGMIATVATVPLDKDDDKNAEYVSSVEDIFTFPHGSCHLI